MALTVQATEQPNQKNNRQRNADKPKQQSASHNVYSYFELHKLNPTNDLGAESFRLKSIARIW
jgi:hypothetical protein